MASLLRKAETLYLRLYRFITLDMWLLSRDRLSLPLRFLVATLRVLYMTVSAYLKEGIGMLASSLSYSTVLSIVPMLAVIVGIAKGFGLQNDVRIALNNALPGHQVELEDHIPEWFLCSTMLQRAGTDRITSSSVPITNLSIGLSSRPGLPRFRDRQEKGRFMRWSYPC